jgi:tryptophan-rich sensory protein
MIKQFMLISPRAAYMQYPYLAWLCFAAYINGGVAYLNGGIYF